MESYPRKLHRRERELLDWILPLERPGYLAMRELLGTMEVLGEGKRGPGNLILGKPGNVPDVNSATTAVIALGVVETTVDALTIVVRDEAGDQIEAEVATADGGQVPDHFEEKRRWTLSHWRPGQASPSSGAPVREVQVGDDVVLALCLHDRRIWVHEGRTGIVRPIPVTNFYNELMLVMRVRDPGVALRSDRLFAADGSYSDANLRDAFRAYNALLPKVRLEPSPPKRPPERLIDRLRRRIGL